MALGANGVDGNDHQHNHGQDPRRTLLPCTTPDSSSSIETRNSAADFTQIQMLQTNRNAPVVLRGRMAMSMVKMFSRLRVRHSDQSYVVMMANGSKTPSP